MSHSNKLSDDSCHTHSIQAFVSFFLAKISSLGLHLSVVREGPSLSPDSLLVIGPVLTKAGVGLGLGGVLDVGVVEEVLDTEQDLLDGDGGPPVLLLVQDGETD